LRDLRQLALELDAFVADGAAEPLLDCRALGGRLIAERLDLGLRLRALQGRPRLERIR